MWKVITGKLEREFYRRLDAVKFARSFTFAQIIDQFGYVRYVVRNYRLHKL